MGISSGASRTPPTTTARSRTPVGHLRLAAAFSNQDGASREHRRIRGLVEVGFRRRYRRNSANRTTMASPTGRDGFPGPRAEVEVEPGDYQRDVQRVHDEDLEDREVEGAGPVQPPVSEVKLHRWATRWRRSRRRREPETPAPAPPPAKNHLDLEGATSPASRGTRPAGRRDRRRWSAS